MSKMIDLASRMCIAAVEKYARGKRAILTLPIAIQSNWALASN